VAFASRYVPWSRQPQIAAPPNWVHPLTRDLLFVQNGMDAWTPSGHLLPEWTQCPFGASTEGIGPTNDGNLANAVRYNIGATLSANDGCTLEFFLNCSTYPQLSALGALSTTQESDGAALNINSVGDVRSILAFNGSLGAGPYQWWWWGSSIDMGSGAFPVLNAPQHVVVTKAYSAGTLAYQSNLTFYVNGVQVFQGTPTGGTSNNYVASGPYFYILTRHPYQPATANSVGTMFKSSVYRRELAPAEVAALAANPWQIFQ
jgi:hypothetical protein